VISRFALKAATDDLHRDLDHRLSRLDLSRAEDYRRFLSFHARTVPPIECNLATAGLDGLLDGWSEGRSLAAITADMEALGEPLPPPARAPVVEGIGAVLGFAYVLEGSRLGARVLRRRVGNGMPLNYLTDSDAGRWPRMLAALDQHLSTEERLGEAQHAARECFTLFVDVAREAGL